MCVTLDVNKIINMFVEIQEKDQLFVMQVKVDCSKTVTHSFFSDDGLTIMRSSNTLQVSSQNGASVSCDVVLEVCSFNLDGWLHGTREFT